eukprot:510861_1
MVNRPPPNTNMYVYIQPFWNNAQVDAEDNCGGASDPTNPSWFKQTSKITTPTTNKNDYFQKMYDELLEQGYERKQLVNIWSTKVCEYKQKQNDNICIMPQYFDDCSNMPMNS